MGKLEQGWASKPSKKQKLQIKTKTGQKLSKAGGKKKQKPQKNCKIKAKIFIIIGRRLRGGGGNFPLRPSDKHQNFPNIGYRTILSDATLSEISKDFFSRMLLWDGP